VNEVRVSLRQSIDFYNAERKHQTLEKTPNQAYFGIEALPKVGGCPTLGVISKHEAVKIIV
jgi:hypothetical protein